MGNGISLLETVGEGAVDFSLRVNEIIVRVY